MSMEELMRKSLKSLNEAKAEDAGNKKQGVFLDSVGETSNGADKFQYEALKVEVAAAFHQWAETDDTDEGETLSDRLVALLVGIVDQDKDGDLNDEEQDLLEEVINIAFNFLAEMGVPEDDAADLVENFTEDVAERIRGLLVETLSENDEDIDRFAFSAEQEPLFDASYKQVMAFRGGRKVRIKKRISGTVRLTAKQKVAIKKAQRKAFSSTAKHKRIKTMRMRRKAMGA